MISKKKYLIFAVAILLVSPIYITGTLAAEPTIKLPPGPVTIEAFNSTKAYFDTKLTDVPSGYTISNGSYGGWCVDRTAEMTRSPAQHKVLLYSSLSPPAYLANEKWSMVNYILNHKQGDPIDIQYAIWYFIDMQNDTGPTSTKAQAMINDAQANGTSFVPTGDQLLALICYPFTNVGDVQISIVEVTRAGVNPEPQPDGQTDNTIRPFWETNPQATIAVIAAAIGLVILTVLTLLRRKR